MVSVNVDIMNVYPSEKVEKKLGLQFSNTVGS